MLHLYKIVFIHHYNIYYFNNYNRLLRKIIEFVLHFLIKKKTIIALTV